MRQGQPVPDTPSSAIATSITVPPTHGPSSGDTAHLALSSFPHGPAGSWPPLPSLSCRNPGSWQGLSTGCCQSPTPCGFCGASSPPCSFCGAVRLWRHTPQESGADPPTLLWPTPKEPHLEFLGVGDVPSAWGEGGHCKTHELPWSVQISSLEWTDGIYSAGPFTSRVTTTPISTLHYPIWSVSLGWSRNLPSKVRG